MFHKFKYALVLAFGLVFASPAMAGKIVVEFSGNSFTFGSDFIGGLGFSGFGAGVDITAQDILDATNDDANIVGLFADDTLTTPFISATTAGFRSFDLEGNGEGDAEVLFIQFSNTVVFTNNTSVFDMGGTATLGTNGNLGEFVPATAVPAPGALGLLGLGLVGLGALRRRKAA